MATLSAPKIRTTRSSKNNFLKQARQLHLYLGTFFAPAIVFFAFSGALQIFGLHETHPGETYRPPAWIAKLALIHKKQLLSDPRRKPQTSSVTSEQRAPKPPSTYAADDRIDGSRKTRTVRLEQKPDSQQISHEAVGTRVLKWYFFVMSVGLILTTFLGLYMAFKYNRSRVLLWSLLLAGAIFPAGLLLSML